MGMVILPTGKQFFAEELTGQLTLFQLLKDMQEDAYTISYRHALAKVATRCALMNEPVKNMVLAGLHEFASKCQSQLRRDVETYLMQLSLNFHVS